MIHNAPLLAAVRLYAAVQSGRTPPSTATTNLHENIASITASLSKDSEPYRVPSLTTVILLSRPNFWTCTECNTLQEQHNTHMCPVCMSSRPATASTLTKSQTDTDTDTEPKSKSESESESESHFLLLFFLRCYLKDRN